MNESLRVDLERYLDGGMTPEEASAFLASVRQDPEALSCLGRALEDQAHLFDVIRAAAPAASRGDTTRRLRHRRARSRSESSSGLQLFWIVGLAAAGIFAALLALSSSEPRPRSPSTPSPREVAVKPADPTPEPPRIPEPKPPISAPSPQKTPPPTRPETPTLPPRENPTPTPVPEAPRPEAPSSPREAPKPTTAAVAVAVLNRVQGDCVVVDAAGKSPAKTGATLYSGQGLQCVGSGSAASFKFPDGTRIDLQGSTSLRECSQGAGGKRLQLDSGTLQADVAKQGPAAPFIVATPQAEIVVVGTRFSVACAPDATRVEVREGRVRVTRLSDGASTEVGPENTATIAAGVPVEAKLIPIDDILLSPAQGKILGADWRVVKDAETGTGTALETLKSRSGALQEAPCVVFTLNAEAGKTYHVWVRGKCLAKAARIEHDAVIVDFGDGEVTEPPGPNKGVTGSLERALFNGFMHSSGYGWVGSDSDRGRDVAAVTVRFARPGRQTLKLYAWESPLRIDSIWLSAAQKTRPDDLQTGPLSPKK